MFNVKLDFESIIDGCPKDGLDAVKYREQHGIPPAPTNVMRIDFSGESRTICEALSDYLDEQADLLVKGQCYGQGLVPVMGSSNIGFSCQLSGQETRRYAGRLTLSVQVIRDWCSATDETRETALLALLQECEQRHKEAVQAVDDAIASEQAEDARREAAIVARIRSLTPEQRAIVTDATGLVNPLPAYKLEARVSSLIGDVEFPENPSHLGSDAYRTKVYLANLAIREDLEREHADRVSAERAQRESERRDWIEQHGSERLQLLANEGIEHDAVYFDERLAHNLPGWVWERSVDGSGDEPRNPPLSAFETLDEARKSLPDATLQYWTIDRDEEDYYDNPDSGKYAWTGYVAASRFLGRDVIFGIPSAYVD